MSDHIKSECMIRLVDVSKRYPGTEQAAVQPLSMEIASGEFIVFVGPSGCGKTTTLRMINRLIEPTTGEIWIDGRDVTHADPDELRRHIGYVIQQVGLLPHMTIAQNISLVPAMLGWDKRKTAARVDELLDLVGLAPSTFRSRYPKQLSGGQQQRIGVARALAADPPLMLMDEPFGAIDPIARDRLQDEFLDLQQRIRKTIVFVTHDIDEALKLGDRIAIFAEGSRLAQFDTPREILSRPADDFVRSFIGERAAIRRLALITVGEAVAQAKPTDVVGPALVADPTEAVATVIDRMLTQDLPVVEVGAKRVLAQDLLFASSQHRGRDTTRGATA